MNNCGSGARAYTATAIFKKAALRPASVFVSESNAALLVGRIRAQTEAFIIN